MAVPIAATPYLLSGAVPLPPAAQVAEAFLWTTFTETKIGQTFSYISEAEFYEIPQRVAFTFSADAALGDRYVQVKFKDDRARDQWFSPALAATGPLAGLNVSASLDAPTVLSVDGAYLSLFMPQWVMLPGYRIILSTGINASPGDTWFNVGITTIRVPTGPSIAPPAPSSPLPIIV